MLPASWLALMSGPCWLPWKTSDDWMNVLSLVGQLVCFFIFLSIFRPNVKMETLRLSYNMSETLRPNSTCKLENFNSNCTSGIKSLVTMTCKTCRGTPPTDQFKFEYLWFLSGYSSTQCIDFERGSPTANLPFGMEKWDDLAFNPRTIGTSLTFAFLFGNNSQVFSGPVTSLLPAGFPGDPWNTFNIELIDVLARYQRLGIVVLDQRENNVEIILADLAKQEVFAKHFPTTSATVCFANVRYDWSLQCRP